MQKFSLEYTRDNLSVFLHHSMQIPFTSTRTKGWIGTLATLERSDDGHAYIKTGWKEIVKYAKLKEGDICLFCFYNGGPKTGCFMTTLKK